MLGPVPEDISSLYRLLQTVIDPLRLYSLLFQISLPFFLSYNILFIYVELHCLPNFFVILGLTFNPRFVRLLIFFITLS